MEEICSGDEHEPRVAVVLPVYNTERYLKECLDSLLSQSYKNFIIIVVNDGSTDGSEEILNEYLKDIRIALINKQNGGVSSARNAALDKIAELGDVELVCFVDSDDIVAVNYLSSYVYAATRYHADYVVCGWTSFDKFGIVGNNKKNSSTSPECLSSEEMFDHTFKVGKWKFTSETSISYFLSNRCFSWGVVGNIRFDERLKKGEDQDFLIRALLNVKKCVILNDVNYFYRLRYSSLSHKETLIEDDISLCFRIINMALNEKYPVYARARMEERVLQLWWQSLRTACIEGIYPKYKSLFDDLYKRFAKHNFNYSLSFQYRRRFLVYSMGEGALKIYFAFNKSRAKKNRLQNAYE